MYINTSEQKYGSENQALAKSDTRLFGHKCLQKIFDSKKCLTKNNLNFGGTVPCKDMQTPPPLTAQFCFHFHER